MARSGHWPAATLRVPRSANSAIGAHVRRSERHLSAREAARTPGYKIFCAWLNHDDSRSLNTFDAYVEEDGRRYIRHYLLDFGSNLGSATTSAQQPRGGNEYYLESGEIFKGIFSFGLWSRDWMHVTYPDYPSVGNVEAEFFEPSTWKPQYPNPAFTRMDAADAFWAARIVSRFTDEMLRAIVAEGEISDPEAAAYLTDVIITRRDKVVNYWISRTNPLDRFELHPPRRHGAGADLRERGHPGWGSPAGRDLQGSLVGAGQPLRPGDTRG